MIQERIYKALERPILSEKTMNIMVDNQYAFKVKKNANKKEIKDAVEALFKVKVEQVNVSNVKSKPKRFGRLQGRQNAWKKAYVKLKPGYEIDVTGAQA